MADNKDIIEQVSSETTDKAADKKAVAKKSSDKKAAVKKTTAAETYAPVRALPPTAAATKSTSPVRTGDGNPLLAHLLLMTAAAVMIVMTGRKKTRR